MGGVPVWLFVGSSFLLHIILIISHSRISTVCLLEIT